MEDNRIFPFFTEDEVKQNTFFMMLMSQEELLKRVNEVNTDKEKLTKDEFFNLLQNSPNLQELLKDAVITAVRLTDWVKCHDIAAANQAKKEKEENQIRRENIRLV